MIRGRQHYWWEAHLEICSTTPGPSNRNTRFYLLHTERNVIIARGDGLDELNELAEKYFHRLFEHFFLN